MDSSADSTTATGGDTSPSLDSLSFWTYMAAGSVAGMVEYMAMFPVDTLKTRMQMAGATSASPLPGNYAAHFSHFFASIVHTEGLLGLYRGIAAIALAPIPPTSSTFPCLRHVRNFGGRHSHHCWSTPPLASSRPPPVTPC
ncbi:Mitochondrial substrate carrier family protein U [Camellia lanceoleosa]|uniref:Mitochondrial substrate carrier family protein U n=1 Tax=Camellia lanceoleosa TaxID=1840588 RepID=A0ACC0IGH2_9ERIC|nr:Mitochondrial substrate carrier family protein U [Camellia lanceoleosa]